MHDLLYQFVVFYKTVLAHCHNTEFYILLSSTSDSGWRYHITPGPWPRPGWQGSLGASGVSSINMTQLEGSSSSSRCVLSY